MDKVHRKQRRKQTLYLKQEPETDITFQEDPSLHVFIGNGGLKNGIPKEILQHILNIPNVTCTPTPQRLLEQLYLPSGRDYAFATFTNIPVAAKVVTSLNGVCVQEECRRNECLLPYLSAVVLDGPPVHLYLSFVNKIPYNVNGSAPTADSDCNIPPGLILLEKFISTQEEEILIEFFTFSQEECYQNKSGNDTSDKLKSSGNVSTDANTSLSCQSSAGTAHRFPEALSRSNTTSSSCDDTSSLAVPSKHIVPKAALKHRHVMHYGYEFLYGANIVDPSLPLPGGLPLLCRPLLDRMVLKDLVNADKRPDQLTVNKYLPGAGIPSHVDTHSVFQGPIISLSLGSQVVMEFKHPDGRKVPVFLPGRSLLIMTGEARYLWSHGIPARKYDEVFPGLLGYSKDSSKNAQPCRNVLCRSTRISLTFRTIRSAPCICTCDYPLHCDSVSK